MRKIICSVTGIVVFGISLLGVTAPANALDWNNCQVSTMTFYEWPGGGSIDSGISVSLTRDTQVFGSAASGSECSAMVDPYRSIVKSEVASKGVFTYQLMGGNLRSSTPCHVSVAVNGQAWIEGDSEYIAGLPDAQQFRPILTALQRSELKNLFTLGDNTIVVNPICEGQLASGHELTGHVTVVQESAGEIAGVSINDGAEWTNSRNVNLSFSFDGLIAQIAVSNDGGFSRSQTQVFNYVRNSKTWTLRASSDERLPKVVYVRYRLYGAANDGSLGAWVTATLTDDIILDTVKPSITETSFSTSSLLESSLRFASNRGIKIKVSARDNKSGVSKLQVNSSASTLGAVTTSFSSRKTLQVPGSWTNIYVRVRDGAGNWSNWKRASKK